jgi:hypothetical protein
MKYEADNDPIATLELIMEKILRRTRTFALNDAVRAIHRHSLGCFFRRLSEWITKSIAIAAERQRDDISRPPTWPTWSAAAATGSVRSQALSSRGESRAASARGMNEKTMGRRGPYGADQSRRRSERHHLGIHRRHRLLPRTLASC